MRAVSTSYALPKPPQYLQLCEDFKQEFMSMGIRDEGSEGSEMLVNSVQYVVCLPLAYILSYVYHS